jgi:hypothetical protein
MIATTMNEPLYLLMRPMFKIAQEQLIGIADRFYTKITKFCSLINFKSFRNQWLNSNGMPIFTFNFTADQRNRQMKLILYQTLSCEKTKVKFFTGNLLVQLRDLKQPHEFKFQVENVLLQQQMKYFAHKPKKKKTSFYFVNDTKEDINIYNGIMWVSIDPTHSWVMRVVPRLPEFMLHYMLKLVRDVYTQHETLSALEEWKNTSETQDKLKMFLSNTQCFYGVRGHAARELAVFANDDEPDTSHKKILIDWYKANFFDNDKPKNHNFQNLANHFVQLEVIKSLSVIRNSTNFTPDDVIKLLVQIIEESDNNGNQYSDDKFQEEASLALGRINPLKSSGLVEIESKLVERVRGSQMSGGFCNSLISSRYIALTANLLKQRDEIDGPPFKDRHNQTIQEMRTILFDDSLFIQYKSEIFRCLLFFALIEMPITFSELISYIKKLASSSKKMLAASLLRELYRFVLNTPPYDGKDRFETYLLRFPREMKRNTVIDKITKGENALEIAETLWSIMTIDAKYHSILRSECLRAYTTLYGQSTPEPFLNRQVKPKIELTTSILSLRMHVESKTKHIHTPTNQ